MPGSQVQDIPLDRPPRRQSGTAITRLSIIRLDVRKNIPTPFRQAISSIHWQQQPSAALAQPCDWALCLQITVFLRCTEFQATRNNQRPRRHSLPFPPQCTHPIRVTTTFQSFGPCRLLVCILHPSAILHGCSTDFRSTMNSLNFVSSRVSPTSTPGPSRSNSFTSMGLTVTSEEQHASQEADYDEKDARRPEHADFYHSHHESDQSAVFDENTPLLQGDTPKDIGARQSQWHLIPKRIASALINSFRWVLITLAAPGVYLVAFLYDEEGSFSPLLPLRKLFGIHRKEAHRRAAGDQGTTPSEIINIGRGNAMATRPIFSSGSSSSGLSSESESEQDPGDQRGKTSGRRNSRSKPQSSEEINPSRRSIRIKLHSEETLRQRKHKKGQSSGSSVGSASGKKKDISAHLKSPTSPAGALTKYPRTPAPPRPLIPRRQPSYINLEPNGHAPQKTLILDLDETLIHSMSKGGRMSTGHMVEVKLNTTYVGVGGQASIGPQHPILYYVHKRPHCDDFLRRVSLHTGFTDLFGGIF